MDATPDTTKCECGAAAVCVMAFRSAPRVLCRTCYDRKSLRFAVSEQFLIDALAVIANTTGLKSSTMDALRELVTSNAPAQ